MVSMKMMENTKDWQECGATGTLISYWWECKLVQPLGETVLQYLLDPNICVPYDAAVPLLRVHPTKAIVANQGCKDGNNRSK